VLGYPFFHEEVVVHALHSPAFMFMLSFYPPYLADILTLPTPFAYIYFFNFWSPLLQSHAG